MQLEAQRKDCTSSVWIWDHLLDSASFLPFYKFVVTFLGTTMWSGEKKCNFLRIAACGMHFLLQEYSLLVFEGQASNFILVTVNGEYKCSSQLLGLSLYIS